MLILSGKLQSGRKPLFVLLAMLNIVLGFCTHKRPEWPEPLFTPEEKATQELVIAKMTPAHQVIARKSLLAVENEYLLKGAMNCANDIIEKSKKESDKKDSKGEDPKK